MQTFLPYPDFQKSAKCLDDRRLNKQIIEAMTIYNIIKENRTKGGWVNHPATKMWRDYKEAIALYFNECLKEWKKRGHNHKYNEIEVESITVKMPIWFGRENFHAAHRSNLLRKMPEHYGKFGWKEPDNLPYLWSL